MYRVVPIVLSGHQGKMGQMLHHALAAGDQLAIAAEAGSSEELGKALASGAEAVVDFSVPAAAFANAELAAKAGIAPVVGTTGLRPDQVDQLQRLCATCGGAVIPNFATGAVLMMRLAEIAAAHFDKVEVIERHDVHKRDAPSGTAVATRARLEAARPGGPAVEVHSVRLPGVVAEQEVVFGSLGQTLTIAHRTTSRDAYVPGIVATVRAVVEQRRFFRSLDEVLGL